MRKLTVRQLVDRIFGRKYWMKCSTGGHQAFKGWLYREQPAEITGKWVTVRIRGEIR